MGLEPAEAERVVIPYANPPLTLKRYNLIIIQQNFVCGDGRTRTAVQTPHQRAFYTLSLPLVFDLGLPEDWLPKTYPLNLSGT